MRSFSTPYKISLVCLVLGIVYGHACSNGSQTTEEKYNGYIASITPCKSSGGNETSCFNLSIQLENGDSISSVYYGGETYIQGKKVWPDSKNNSYSMSELRDKVHNIVTDEMELGRYVEITTGKGDAFGTMRSLNLHSKSTTNPNAKIVVMPIDRGNNGSGASELYFEAFKDEEIIGVHTKKETFIEDNSSQLVSRENLLFKNPLVISGKWTGKDSNKMNQFEANHISATDISGFKIVFGSKRDRNEEIYTMDLNGNNQKNITNSSSEDGTPSFSPDQRSVVFASNRNGYWDIYKMPSLENSSVINLTNNKANNGWPMWSPKGDRILFISNGEHNEKHEIYLMNSDGLHVKQLTVKQSILEQKTATFQEKGVNISDFGVSHASWSPDGEDIVFTLTNGKTSAIYTCNIDSMYVSGITTGIEDADKYVDYPSWSPGNKYIVYASNEISNDGDRLDLIIHEIGTGKKKTLIKSEFDVRYPAWTPDGRLVFTIASRHDNNNATREIYITKKFIDINSTIEVKGGNDLIQLTKNDFEDNHPFLVFSYPKPNSSTVDTKTSQ
jgi:Tol biopolymer transport system component